MVRISWPVKGQENVEAFFDIDSDSWASIVAHVSHKGETSETFWEALKLHNGEQPNI